MDGRTNHNALVFPALRVRARFSQRTRFHANDASACASIVENDALCFCGKTVSDTRRFSETDDYANRDRLLTAVLITEQKTLLAKCSKNM